LADTGLTTALQSQMLLSDDTCLFSHRLSPFPGVMVHYRGSLIISSIYDSALWDDQAISDASDAARICDPDVAGPVPA
jgi:hypothetical protein